MKKIISSLLLTGAIVLGNSQVKTPQPSPSATVKQAIGLSDVTVEYSRPSANERKIFGNLVPMNQIWRTGANGSTDITFGSEALFDGGKVAAGKYALYVIPMEKEWEVILYKDTEIWGAPKEFKSELIVAKAKVKTENNPLRVETFTIGFNDLKTDKANLVISWENTMVRVPIEMDSKNEVLESIEKTLGSKEAKGSDYNQAASYYFQEKMDMKKALEYATKANDLQPDLFYMLKLKAEIQAANGMKKEAIETAKKSMELSKKASNEDYVKMNVDNIAKWSK
jgi:tetratricopeptide (TPR) repeat protein